MTWVEKAGSAKEAYDRARQLDPQAKLEVSKVGEGQYLVKTGYSHISGRGPSATVSHKVDTYTESVKHRPPPEQPSVAVQVEPGYATPEEAELASQSISKSGEFHSTRVVQVGGEYAVMGQYTGDQSRIVYREEAPKREEAPDGSGAFTQARPQLPEGRIPKDMRFQGPTASTERIVALEEKRAELETARERVALAYERGMGRQIEAGFGTGPHNPAPPMARAGAGLTETVGAPMVTVGSAFGVADPAIFHETATYVAKYPREAVGEAMMGAAMFPLLFGHQVVGSVRKGDIGGAMGMAAGAAVMTAASAGAAKAVGLIRAHHVPLSHSVGTGKVYVASHGKSALGTSQVLTVAGEKGKHGTFLTKVSSSIKNMGQKPVTRLRTMMQGEVSSKTVGARDWLGTEVSRVRKQASVRVTRSPSPRSAAVTEMRGEHVFTTQKIAGRGRKPVAPGKEAVYRGETVELIRFKDEFRAASLQTGKLEIPGKRGTKSSAYSLGQARHLKTIDIAYKHPTVVEVGPGKYALATGKARTVSYGKGVSIRLVEGTTKPRLVHTVRLVQKEVTPEAYARMMQKSGGLKVVRSSRMPNAEAFADYNPRTNTIRLPPKGVLPKKGNILAPSEKDVLAHELAHYKQRGRIVAYNKELTAAVKGGRMTKANAQKLANEYVGKLEMEAEILQHTGKLTVPKVVHRPAVSVTKPLAKVTGKGQILSKADIYQLADPGMEMLSGAARKAPRTVLARGAGPSMVAAEELAKRAGERAAIMTMSKEMSPKLPLPPPAPRVRTQQAGLDVVVQSPARLIYGERKKVKAPEEIPGTVHAPREKVMTLSGTGMRTVSEQRRDSGRRTAPLTDFKFGTGLDDRVITGLVTPQAVTERVRQRQSGALLHATLTGQRMRVAPPSMQTEELMPPTFVPASPMFGFGMDLEAPARKRKAMPRDWWAGLWTHPVKDPLAAMMGIVRSKKGGM